MPLQNSLVRHCSCRSESGKGHRLGCFRNNTLGLPHTANSLCPSQFRRRSTLQIVAWRLKELFTNICPLLKTVTSLRRCQPLFLAEKLGYPFDVSAGRSPEGGDLWGGSQCIGPYLKRMLKAHLFELDKDYIIRDQNIVILSPNTGRTQERSRWSDGVHQVTMKALNAILSYF